MVKSNGPTRKGRHILKYAKSNNKYQYAAKLLTKYQEGDRVAVIIDSRSKRGLPHIRHHGLQGVVVKKYKKGLNIKTFSGKSLIINKIHVKKI